MAGGGRPEKGAHRPIVSQLPYGAAPRINEAMRR